MRPDGIYYNSESEVWGLCHKGEFVMISVEKQDCVDGAVALGMTPPNTH